MLSPIPILPRTAAASPHREGRGAGTTDGVPAPWLTGSPGLTCCPGTVQGGESQEGQRQLPHGCPAGDCERGGTAGLYMRPFPRVPSAGSDAGTGGWTGVKREAGRSPPRRGGRPLPRTAPARET